MIKGFRQIAVLTMMSRILGMLRDMGFSGFLGCSNVMDIWVIAFKVPNLSRRIFGEGALASSFIPVYVEQLDLGRAQARRLSGAVALALFIVLTSMTAAGMALLTLYAHGAGILPETQRMLMLTATMLPYMVMICLVAAFAGILQSHRHFAAPAAAPILLNTVIITALLISGLVFKKGAYDQIGFVAVSVLVAGLLQLGLQWWVLRRLDALPRYNWQFNSEPFRRVMLLMGPMVIGLTATQLNTLADDVIAKVLSGSSAKGESFQLLGHTLRYPEWAGCVSSLFYAQRLYQFPLGVLGISLATAIFPIMSTEAAQGDLAGMCHTLRRGIRGALFVALPATAGLFLVATPLVSTIFEQGQFTATDTPLVSQTLVFYALGLTGYFLQQLLTRAFYALQESRVPCRSALLAVGINVLLNLILIWPLGRRGLALATALSAYVQVWVLSRALRRHLGESVWAGSLSTLLRSLLGTAVMAGGGALAFWWLQSWPDTRLGNLGRVVVLVPLAAGLYWGMARVLRIDSLDLITGRMRKP
jgi:putative peptidoglycan lipid II flippase